MKILSSVRPSSEQLPIISNPRAGVTLIRGAAGSGKTTTALLMLKQLSSFWVRYLKRQNEDREARVLVLTFNRTLRGYIDQLAESQISTPAKLELSVLTFGNWSFNFTRYGDVFEGKPLERKLLSLGKKLPLDPNFVIEETEYCMGRFLPHNLSDYLTSKRIGRGIAPRVDRSLRQRLLAEVVYPYYEWKGSYGYVDWNDLALEAIEAKPDMKYDVIIADEAQDFSANQIRAVINHANNPASIIFVLDAAQRIYPRGCTWTEAGVTIDCSFRLKENHRNTQEICRFAAPLLVGLDLGDDGTIPDLNSCTRIGPLPIVLKGKYSPQCDYSISHITSNIDLKKDSVAFLQPKGGGWFDCLKRKLNDHGLNYVDMTRRKEWPKGVTNIGLTTMHSAKGLEFDHVFMLGLSDELLVHGNQKGDTTLERLRRMLAMSITRARKSLILGYKPGEETDLISFLEKGTFREIVV